MNTVSAIPRAFVWRRLHSLMGLWLVLFLVEHLLVNSQAAFFLGENGKGFVEMVNKIHGIPFLKVVEFVLLAIPFAIHMFWGIKYLFTAKPNSGVLKYGRNRAYTWQRITSWILLVGVIAHVTKFRFLDYPESVNGTYYTVLELDPGLYTAAAKIKVNLYDAASIQKQKASAADHQTLLHAAQKIKGEKGEPFDMEKATILLAAQEEEEQLAWIAALERKDLQPNQVIATADNFGTISLLLVRQTFQNPIYVGLYSIFVLAACFHAFNGFWTFLITWGAILSMAAQRKAAAFAWGLMFLVALLGWISIWGTYLA